MERLTGYHLQIERLATGIVGENPAQESFGYAYQMAAALLDQRRIREARPKLPQDPAERVKDPPLGKVNWAINRTFAFAKGKASGDDKATADGLLAHFEGYKYSGVSTRWRKASRCSRPSSSASIGMNGVLSPGSGRRSSCLIFTLRRRQINRSQLTAKQEVHQYLRYLGK
jgi:hypothetical protein